MGRDRIMMGFLEAVIAGVVAAALVLWVVRPWRS